MKTFLIRRFLSRFQSYSFAWKSDWPKLYCVPESKIFVIVAPTKSKFPDTFLLKNVVWSVLYFNKRKILSTWVNLFWCSVTIMNCSITLYIKNMPPHSPLMNFSDLVHQEHTSLSLPLMNSFNLVFKNKPPTHSPSWTVLTFHINNTPPYPFPSWTLLTLSSRINLQPTPPLWIFLTSCIKNTPPYPFPSWTLLTSSSRINLPPTPPHGLF